VTKVQESIKTDLSLLTSREKLNLLMKEAPELPVIAEELQGKYKRDFGRIIASVQDL